VVAHGVAADDQIANLSGGERRQQIDEVQRQVRRVLLHTIPSPARRPRRDGRGLASPARRPRRAQRHRHRMPNRRSIENDALPLEPRHCGWQMTSPSFEPHRLDAGGSGEAGLVAWETARRGSVIARVPLMMPLMRLAGTARSRANALLLISSGRMNSSIRISPGGTGSSIRAVVIPFLSVVVRPWSLRHAADLSVGRRALRRQPYLTPDGVWGTGWRLVAPQCRCP